jgi:hypothetical protein
LPLSRIGIMHITSTKARVVAIPRCYNSVNGGEGGQMEPGRPRDPRGRHGMGQEPGTDPIAGGVGTGATVPTVAFQSRP